MRLGGVTGPPDVQLVDLALNLRDAPLYGVQRLGGGINQTVHLG
jgi:hypothetical protein